MASPVNGRSVMTTPSSPNERSSSLDGTRGVAAAKPPHQTMERNASATAPTGLKYPRLVHALTVISSRRDRTERSLASQLPDETGKPLNLDCIPRAGPCRGSGEL